MSAQGFDDPGLRAAMTAYLDAARSLDDTSSVGGEARNLLDLAEAKTLAALRLRKRLAELGWSAPVRETSSMETASP